MNAATLARFRRVCGMLASPYIGESSAAAEKATAMLREAGLTWESVNVGADGGLAHRTIETLETLLQCAEADRAEIWDLRERNTRLQREVERLRGMWPKGEPKGRAA